MRYGVSTNLLPNALASNALCLDRIDGLRQLPFVDTVHDLLLISGQTENATRDFIMAVAPRAHDLFIHIPMP